MKGQAHDHDIEDHINHCGCPALTVDVVAVIRVRTVPAQPGSPNRPTLEHSDAHECKDVGKIKADSNVTQPAEGLLRENAEIEEENGYLRQCEGAEI